MLASMLSLPNRRWKISKSPRSPGSDPSRTSRTPAMVRSLGSVRSKLRSIDGRRVE